MGPTMPPGPAPNLPFTACRIPRLWPSLAVLDASSAQPSIDLLGAGLVGWMAASVCWRLWAAKPIFASVRPAATFSERWASARLGRGLIGRLSTAKNCLHVQVSDGALLINPHFPFTLAFMPEVYGLDKRIPLRAVRSATIVGGVHAKVVEVVYLDPREREQMLQLLLRHAEGFLPAVLAGAGGAST